jgi:hypothetical protein
MCVQYAPFKSGDSTHTINIDTGHYYESTWEIPSGDTTGEKNFIVGGNGKELTLLTIGPQNYNGFIICSLGL